MFKTFVGAAGLAGLLSGLLLTAVEQVQIAPLILAAERYERAVETPGAHAQGTNDHASAAPATQTLGKRTLATALANIVLATGFALLFASAMSRRDVSGWRAGVLWGIAGYVVFFVAPSIGLPPLLPGGDAAPLVTRELWWAITVGFSAAGLGLVLLRRHPALRLLGVALIIVPHLLGAPQPDEHLSNLPADLTRQFIVASFAANAVFWVALGGATGHFLRARTRQRTSVE